MSSRELLKLALPARPDALKAMRDSLHAALAQVEPDEATRERLVLAVHEAACNVIRHAYCGCEGMFRLTLRQERGILRFALRDYAPPVDPACVRPRDLSECRPGGLGINFIDETMDGWRLRPLKRRRGNVLTMRKRPSRTKAGRADAGSPKENGHE